MPDVNDNSSALPSILVMDDDEDARELFEVRLEMLGYRPIMACDGNEAISLYGQALESDEPIAAAILDLTIPGGIGGKEVAKKIRELDPDARLVVASGYSGGGEMTHFADYGFNGALEKNFNREKLKQLLDRLLSD